jgi:16S rRNA (uracil1498-N3)-methyltransferase
MDYTVQKAVELGVTRIQPLETGRSIVRLTRARAERRAAHWQAVAVAACEQCGRNRVPPVEPIAALRDWLARDERGPAAARPLRLLLAPDRGASLRDLPRPAGRIVVLAGPEGGFAPEEAKDAERAGFLAVRLGPRVLRTETAALAALAAMQLLWGDF